MAGPSAKLAQFEEGEKVDVWWPHENAYKRAVVIGYASAKPDAYLSKAGWIREGDKVDLMYGDSGAIEKELGVEMVKRIGDPQPAHHKPSEDFHEKKEEEKLLQTAAWTCAHCKNENCGESEKKKGKKGKKAKAKEGEWMYTCEVCGKPNPNKTRPEGPKAQKLWKKAGGMLRGALRLSLGFGQEHEPGTTSGGRRRQSELDAAAEAKRKAEEEDAARIRAAEEARKKADAAALAKRNAEALAKKEEEEHRFDVAVRAEGEDWICGDCGTECDGGFGECQMCGAEAPVVQ